MRVRKVKSNRVLKKYVRPSYELPAEKPGKVRTKIFNKELSREKKKLFYA